jgi:hypothetical protein
MKLISSLLVFLACAQASAAGGFVVSGGRPSSSAVYLLFMNQGMGIDQSTLDTADSFIQNAFQSGKVADYFRRPWGRGGEVMICVQLASATDRLAFMREIAPAVLGDARMNGVQRTSVRAGLDCSDYESASEQDLSAYQGM